MVRNYGVCSATMTHCLVSYALAVSRRLLVLRTCPLSFVMRLVSSRLRRVNVVAHLRHVHSSLSDSAAPNFESRQSLAAALSLCCETRRCAVAICCRSGVGLTRSRRWRRRRQRPASPTPAGHPRLADWPAGRYYRRRSGANARQRPAEFPVWHYWPVAPARMCVRVWQLALPFTQQCRKHRPMSSYDCCRF